MDRGRSSIQTNKNRQGLIEPSVHKPLINPTLIIIKAGKKIESTPQLSIVSEFISATFNYYRFYFRRWMELAIKIAIVVVNDFWIASYTISCLRAF